MPGTIFTDIQAYIEAATQESWEGMRCGEVPPGKNGDVALSFFELGATKGVKPFALGAQAIEILKTAPMVDQVEAAGPYVNVTLKGGWVAERVGKEVLDAGWIEDKKIVIEYSGPNTNKPLHLGHMRNHALGMALCRLYETAGAEVIPVNIINDRGIHICKSMLAYKKYGKEETPEQTGEKPDHFVGRYYVRFAQAVKETPALEEEVQQMLRDWEDGEPGVRELWKQMNAWVLAGHAETYARQGVAFEKSYYESECYEDGRDRARKGVEQGVFQVREDGAIIINLEEEGFGEKVVLRADGTTIYLTQDLALAAKRAEDFDPDEMIYVVGDEQKYHFSVLFACLEKLGIGKGRIMRHAAYGLVHLPSGRMKSREGTVVDADDVMDELSEGAKKLLQERHENLGDEEATTIAEQIMNAAWKMAMLSTTPRKDITYDAEKSLAFEGASGPYIQYAGVRIRSIFEKAQIPASTLGDPDAEYIAEGERKLLIGCALWSTAWRQAVENQSPSYIVHYALKLAQMWASYYGATRILEGSLKAQSTRLWVAKCVLERLEASAYMLGFRLPERM